MDKPLVSVILPSLRLSQLKECLASIETYTVGISYEVIVISPYDIESHKNVVCVKETSPEGTYKAVAIGYEYVRGEYIIHIPDDSRATPLWAENMIEFMRRHDDEIFEGNFRHFDVRGERPEPGMYGKLFAPFLCIRKDKVDKIGGLMDCCFRSYWGDPDLSLRVWYSGGRVETCPNAWIYHPNYDDEVHKKSYNRYFIDDHETFVKRWHHIYARPGESKRFYASSPLNKKPPSFDLPPEECTRLYISIEKKDWETVRNIIMSKSANLSFYSEGLPILYSLATNMLKLSDNPKEPLYSVFEWIRQKGYVSSPFNGELKGNLLIHQRIWSSIMDIVDRLSVTIKKD